MQIDELVVKLTMDVADLKKGQAEYVSTLDSIVKKTDDASKKKNKADNDEFSSIKKKNDEEAKAAKAADKANKERELQSKKQGEALSKLRNDVLAVTAAYLGFKALKDAGEILIGMNAQIGFSADSLGMSSAELNAWINTAKSFNASAEEVTNAFAKINAMQQSFKTGVGVAGATQAVTAYAQAMSGLAGHGTVDTSTLMSRDLNREDFLKEIAFETQKMSLRDMTTAVAELGIGPNVARMMHDPHFLDKLSASKKTDPAADEAIKNSQLLAAQWGRIKAQAKGIADIIENDIMPGLEYVIKKLEGLLDFAKDHPKTTEAVLGTSVAAVALGAGAYTWNKLKNIFSTGAGAEAAAGAGAEAAAGTGAVAGAEAAAGAKAAAGAVAKVGMRTEVGLVVAAVIAALAAAGFITKETLDKFKGTPENDPMTDWVLNGGHKKTLDRLQADKHVMDQRNQMQSKNATAATVTNTSTVNMYYPKDGQSVKDAAPLISQATQDAMHIYGTAGSPAQQ